MAKIVNESNKRYKSIYEHIFINVKKKSWHELERT